MPVHLVPVSACVAVLVRGLHHPHQQGAAYGVAYGLYEPALPHRPHHRGANAADRTQMIDRHSPYHTEGRQETLAVADD